MSTADHKKPAGLYVISDGLRSLANTDEDLTRSLNGHKAGTLLSALDAVPRRRYVKQATPIERLDNLTALLGGAELFCKRDDMLPLAGGGSKTRKLEYIVQAALDAGADILVTCGAVQSNHARLTASAAAREGLACHIILEERVAGSFNPKASGNNYTFALLGATTEVVPADGVPAAEERVMARLRAEGCRPYWVPGGGSNALGSLGYARAALEIIKWTNAHGAFDAIVLCSGSGGTHAGLLAGLRAAGDSTPCIGISTRAATEPQRRKIHALASLTAASLSDVEIPYESVIVRDAYVGPGYSLPTEEMNEAIELFARKESILLDPVYTGKAAAGLLDLVRSGELGAGKRVLFLHTGGAPSLFHYQPIHYPPTPPAPAEEPAPLGFGSLRVSAEEMAAVYGPSSQ
ncbi:tryptophan synthase beta subunit-like PLP-dependent enzyme [Pavlovales sp. CCMP2436]|nr:tryptophan synthase beta subunit-like PLP-dependent enzyme [Pavlovales sp. CCMP2436]